MCTAVTIKKALQWDHNSPVLEVRRSFSPVCAHLILLRKQRAINLSFIYVLGRNGEVKPEQGMIVLWP